METFTREKEKLNRFFDALSPHNKMLLNTFIQNGNKALITHDVNTFEDNFLGNQNIFNSSKFTGHINDIDTSTSWVEPGLQENLISRPHDFRGLCQYKVKCDLFNNLKIMYNVQGKLGSF